MHFDNKSICDAFTYKSLMSPTVGMNCWQLTNSFLLSFQFEKRLQLLSNRMLSVTDTRRYYFRVCLSRHFTAHLTEMKPYKFIRPVYCLPTTCRSFRYHFSSQNFFWAKSNRLLIFCLDLISDSDYWSLLDSQQP